jgi:hypothetical protein
VCLPVEVEIDDGNASWHRFFVEGIIFAAPFLCWGNGGNPLTTLWCCYPCWGIVFGALSDGSDLEVDRCFSYHISFSGMAQRGVGVRCVMVDERRAGALVWHHGGIYGRSVEGFADLSPEDALWFNG